jgi:hypothetical protein
MIGPSAMRRLRDVVKRYEVLLYFVTALLAVYLAVANILRAAKWPDEATWAPGTTLFALVIGCAVWVPLYALYKAIDAHLESVDKEAAAADQRRVTLTADLELLCQQTVAALAHGCDKVGVNDLAAQVWICRPDGTFDRAARFFLPQERPSSGIEWTKGKGVAGMAWKADQHLRSDLRPLHAQLDSLGQEAFDELPADERLGMTAVEVSNTRDYTGICAIRLFSQEAKPYLLAIFVIDYVGETDFECVATKSQEWPVTNYLGSCGKTLTEAKAIL